MLPYKEKIKKKLKMKTENASAELRHYSMSYNSKKQRLVNLNERDDITKTVVGLDD